MESETENMIANMKENIKLASLNLLIVGVGGQGTLLSSKIVGNVALAAGYDVKVSEVHGMAQRGGSVVTYVRLASKVYSPLIEKGEADIILAFEELEALRWIEYLKPEGLIIINEQRINPMSVITGKQKYPEGCIETIRSSSAKTITVKALEAAKKCGSTKAVNIVMIGVLSRFTGISKEKWLDAIKVGVSAKTLTTNIAAFEEGYSLV
ncbi:MAG: indolepyruvate oxidoreductase subunit beta [Clostridiales bacterium]|nr:indolepyruvate oxidoreductase subunit beta [Clostridiales bacterium]